jgi:hypothetical protein
MAQMALPGAATATATATAHYPLSLLTDQPTEMGPPCLLIQQTEMEACSHLVRPKTLLPRLSSPSHYLQMYQVPALPIPRGLPSLLDLPHPPGLLALLELLDLLGLHSRPVHLRCPTPRLEIATDHPAKTTTTRTQTLETQDCRYLLSHQPRPDLTQGMATVHLATMTAIRTKTRGTQDPPALPNRQVLLDLLVHLNHQALLHRPDLLREMVMVHLATAIVTRIQTQKVPDRPCLP